MFKSEGVSNISWFFLSIVISALLCIFRYSTRTLPSQARQVKLVVPQLSFWSHLLIPSLVLNVEEIVLFCWHSGEKHPSGISNYSFRMFLLYRIVWATAPVTQSKFTQLMCFMGCKQQTSLNKQLWSEIKKAFLKEIAHYSFLLKICI